MTISNPEFLKKGKVIEDCLSSDRIVMGSENNKFLILFANICEVTGADVQKVRLGIGFDKRIDYHFIYAGCSYGKVAFQKIYRV